MAGIQFSEMKQGGGLEEPHGLGFGVWGLRHELKGVLQQVLVVLASYEAPAAIDSEKKCWEFRVQGCMVLGSE